MQEVRCQASKDPPTACRHSVSGTVSLPSSGCFSPFPHGTMFAIGHVRVFRLRGWSPYVQTGFHVSRPTQVLRPHFYIRGCHPLWPLFPKCSVNLDKGTGLVRVRSPLLTESRLMSFPPATEMFQFAGFASPKLCIHFGDILPI